MTCKCKSGYVAQLKQQKSTRWYYLRAHWLCGDVLLSNITINYAIGATSHVPYHVICTKGAHFPRIFEILWLWFVYLLCNLDGSTIKVNWVICQKSGPVLKAIDVCACKKPYGLWLWMLSWNRYHDHFQRRRFHMKGFKFCRFSSICGDFRYVFTARA